MRSVYTSHCVSATHVLITLLYLGSLATSAMVGGWRKQDPHSNDGYLHLAHYAVATQTKGLKNYNTVARLLEVSTQVVAGVNYHLKFTTAPTICAIGRDQYSPHSCTPVGKENELCYATISIVPWMHQISVTSYKCSSMKLIHSPSHEVQKPGAAHKGSGSTAIKLR
ncbi:hypothetical protein MTO96_030057 [Rhipicephalus appendiculatus]